MRYLVMHKNDARSEAGERPPKKLIEEMGALIGGYAKNGRLHHGAGLLGSKARTRLTFRDGACTRKDGPYRGEHELPTAMLHLKVKTREEAVGWAERYGKILGNGEIEVGKVTEPWDLGLMPEPAGAPMQFLLIDKADAASEASGRSPKLKAELTRLKTEMTKAGVLVTALALAPSGRAKRLHFKNNDLRVTDGPFAETKELLGGFAVIDFDTEDEVIAMCRRYTEILGGTLEIDVREVVQGAD